MILPNPDLRPETSESIEVGVKANLDRTFLSFALYDNHYDDFIDSQMIGFDSGYLLFRDENVGSARIYGAEASAIFSLDDSWQLKANLAYGHGDDEEANVPLDSVDPFTTVLGLRYTGADDRWSIEPRVTLIASKDRVSSPDVVTASSYNLVDLVGSYRFSDRADLRLGLFNLADEKYARWANISGLPADDPLPVALSQEPGFNVRATLNISF